MDGQYTDKPAAELPAIRAHLLRQLRQVGPELIEGSLAVTHNQCGNPNCRCAHGEKHEKTILCRKVAGRSHATYVPKALVAAVREWTARYQQAKHLLKEISAVNEALIRAYGQEQRRQRALAKKLRRVE
jgi:hypothetical protein